MEILQLTPGWYTDAAEPAFLRYWTGSAWSAHRKPRPGLPFRVQEQRRRAQFATLRRIA